MADSAKYKLTIKLDNGYKFDCGTFEVPYAPSIVDVAVTSTEDDGYTIKLTMSDGEVIESEEFTLDAVATKINARMYAVGYNDGYIHGKDVGYEEGHSVGYSEGYDTATAEHVNDYQTGYDEGYDTATAEHVNDYQTGYDTATAEHVNDYQDGYTSGYDTATAEHVNDYQTGYDTATAEHVNDYQDGYTSGYDTATAEHVDDYQTGYDTATAEHVNDYQDGYTSGYDTATAEHVDDYQTGYDEGYSVGYAEGYDAGGGNMSKEVTLGWYLDYLITDYDGIIFFELTLLMAYMEYGTDITPEIWAAYKAEMKQTYYPSSIASVYEISPTTVTLAVNEYIPYIDMVCEAVNASYTKEQFEAMIGEEAPAWPLPSVSLALDKYSVMDMAGAFYNAGSLTELCSAWGTLDTSSLTTLEDIFDGCSSLTNVDGLADWDVSSVTTLFGTFGGCSALTNVDGLAEWDVSSVTTLEDTFYRCSALTNVDGLAEWDVSAVTTLKYTFDGCSSLTNVDGLAEWDVSSVTTLECTFDSCTSLTSLALGATPKCTTIYGVCYNCQALESATFADLSAVTTTTYAFGSCSKLARLVVTGLRVSFSISESTAFTEESLVELMESLGTPSSTATLTMGSTNLAKLTDEEKAIATDKGWTLA